MRKWNAYKALTTNLGSQQSTQYVEVIAIIIIILNEEHSS